MRTFFSRRTLLAAFVVPVCVMSVPAFGSYLHSDVSIQTYTDFAQNRGRYQTGATNALLQHLNAGGITVSYTGGQYPYSTNFMPDFSSQTDEGFSAGLGVNFIALVQHVGTDPTTTFSGRNVGASNAIVYTGIEYADIGLRGSSYTSQMESDFQWVPKSESGHVDYKITRLNKIVTDVVMSEVYTGTVSAGDRLYRSASGSHFVVDHDGNASTLCANKYQYNVAGIVTAENVTTGVAGTSAVKVSHSVDFSENGIGWSWSDYTKSDLPSSCAEGDSGSPVWVQVTSLDGVTSYQYLGASAELYNNAGKTTNIYGAGQWTQDTMAQFDKKITTGTSAVYIGAVENTGEAISGSAYGFSGAYEVGTTLDYGVVSGGTNGDVQFVGMQKGTYTWGNLSSVKDKDNWYAYQSLDDTTTVGKDNNLLIEKSTSANANDSYLNLYYSENLVFEAGTAESSIYVNSADVDLGIGYVRFSAGTQNAARFDLKSDNGFQLHSAGYVIDENVSVYVHLKNSSKDLYTREWRKIGAGDLHLLGNDDDFYGNDVLLNLGGSGKTYLEYELWGAGYAAYNVLANTGATVVIKDTMQIYRDFTFGNGGGTLDMNGNSMTWNNDNAASDAGFTIHALTEEAVISNSSGHTDLTFTQSGNQTFLGSFKDTASGSLKFIYDGGNGSSLELNGVFTDLSQKSESGISVKSGTLIFRGTNTVHSLGSEDGTNADRLIRSNDWHYADAKTSVSVESGATLQLGSHARLSGNITVRDGGKFVMNEGVHAQNEYIEGGYELENTYAIRDFYGLKGNVSLEGKNSVMEVRYEAGTTSENLYSGKISGEGSLLLELGAGTLVLSGENSHTGGTTIVAGTLLADHANALGNGAVTVQSGGMLSVGENISLSSAAQSLTLVVGAEQASGSTGTALVSSSAGVSISVEGAARLYVDVSALLAQRATLENVALNLASDSALKFNDENACVGWWDESSGEWNDLEGYNISFLRDSVEVLLVIPEPSAFGLLAGLGAIALVVSRRRRS